MKWNGLRTFPSIYARLPNGVRSPLSGVFNWMRADLRVDPYLKYLLLMTLVLAGFFMWYSVPNVTRPDEFSRVLDAIVALNHIVADPSVASLQRGVEHGRAFGASFYLSLLAALPAYLFAFVTGQLDLIISANAMRSRWEIWLSLPEWLWTTSILTGRLFMVLFAIGCVYITYRIGTTMRDRTAGRLAGLLLALSFSFLRQAHEFSEDVPALFFLLLTLYLALRYTETGNKKIYLAGCAAGGLAIGFKFLAGACVFVLGMAYLLRVRRVRHEGATVFAALIRPRLIVGGLALGAGAIALGYPSFLVAGLDPIVKRLTVSTADKASVMRNGTTPILHQLIFFYGGGLGIPLAVTGVTSVLANIPTVRRHDSEANGVALVLTGLSIYFLVYSRWVYVQPHHLLPTFPLFVLLVGVLLSRLDVRLPHLGRAIIAVLIITTGIYASVGVLKYAGDDKAPERWIENEVPAEASMEVLVPRPQMAAPLHGSDVGHYVSPDIGTYDRLKGEGWSPQGFKEWQRGVTERSPDYIQFPRYMLRYLPNDISNRYTVVASFNVNWPLRNEVDILGGGARHGYPEFMPARNIVIMERTDRCGSSPTCQNTSAT